jgi:hypothetical protein
MSATATVSVYATMKQRLMDVAGEAGKAAAYEVYRVNSQGGHRAGENRLEEDFSIVLELFARRPELASRPNAYVRKAAYNAILQGRKADSGGRVVVRDGHQIEAMTGVDMEGNKLEIGETANVGDAARILDLLWRAFEKTLEATIARLDGTQTDAILMQQAMDTWFNYAEAKFGKRDTEIFRQMHENSGRGIRDVAKEYGMTRGQVEAITGPRAPIRQAMYGDLLPMIEAKNAARGAA